MPTPYEILAEMDAILDQLIKTAERLRDISRQVFEEDELIKLQKLQEEMVTKLIDLDEAFKKAYKGHSPKNESIRKNIDKKIEHFQKLNNAFIDNIRESRGVLHFKKKK